MTSTRRDGKRVLLTQSNVFMGPPLTEALWFLGAEVIADDRALDQEPSLPEAIDHGAG
jgi:2-keto-3-deoxy-L-fuconate dehydrogenase